MSVKSIRFSGEITSSGIVNFEGTNAPWAIKTALKDRYGGEKWHNNVKFAKHAIKKVGKTEDGKPIYDVCLKISKDCIRQGIFKEDQPIHNPGIVYSDTIFNKSLASSAGLLRAYFYPEKRIKRKSCIYISEAVQNSNNVSTIDVGTMNAPKKTKEEKDDDSGLTLHYKETIAGLTTYEFEGAIDLSELQFISISETYDRKAIDTDYIDFYISELEKVVGGKIEKGYFIKNTATNGLPEKGILLNSEQVKKLVKDFFERLFDFEIIRGASGRAWLSDLKVMFKENGVDNGEYQNMGNVDEVIGKIDDIHVFYDTFNEVEAIKLYEAMDIGKKKNSDVKKSKKVKKEDPVKEDAIAE